MFHARHLRERRLFECYVAERQGEPFDPRVSEHLSDCEDCAARYSALTAFMDAVRSDAGAESDAVFTPERLRAQQQQIARRIEHLGRAARVISFPKSGGGDRPASASLAAYRRPRRVAAAVAAGLFVGVALGASFEWERPGWLTRDAAATVEPIDAPEIDLAALATIATDGNAPSNIAADDAFLSELEMAVDRPRTLALQPFDEITPHVREIRATR